MKALKIMSVIMGLSLITTIAFADQRAHLSIVNQSNYPMTLESQPSKDMKAWQFPAVISAQTSSTVKVEYNRHWFGNATYGKGIATYNVSCPDGQVDKIIINTSIKLNSLICSNGYCAEYDNVDLVVSHQGESCVTTSPQSGSIGWRENGTMQLIVNNKS